MKFLLTLMLAIGTAAAADLPIQSRLQQVAANVLDDPRAQVVVSRDNSGNDNDTSPYIPPPLAKDFSAQSAGKISIIVFHARKLTSEEQKELTSALAAIAKSENTKISGIKFSRISISANESTSASNQATQKAREDLLQASNKLDKLQSELRKIERERNDKASEAAALKAQITAKAAELAKGPNATNPIEQFFSGIKNNKSAVSVVFSVIILLLLLVVGALTWSLRKMSRAFETGLTSIARSFNDSKAREARIALDGGLPGGGTNVNIENKAGNENANDVIHTGMIEFVDQLKNSLGGMAKTDSLDTIVSYVKDMLASDQTIPDAVGAFELLGQEGAAIAFKRLDPSEQEKMYANIRNIRWPGGKMAALIRTGEMLKTRLLEVQLPKPEAAVNTELARLIDGLNPDQFESLLHQLSPQCIARLSAYMKPSKFAQAITGLVSSKENADAVSVALGNLSDSSANSALDAEIKGIIDTVMGGTSARGTWANNYVAELASTLSEDVVDGIVDRLQQQQSHLAPIIRENVVSSRQFFELPTEIQRDVADTAPAKTLAAWALSLSTDLSANVRNMLEEFQRDVFDEETRRLQANPKAAEAASKDARSYMANVVRQRLGTIKGKRNVA